jgi:diguanylate cyclase (GGDEF)-like protein/PAS domain S-box-containing protein
MLCKFKRHKLQKSSRPMRRGYVRTADAGRELNHFLPFMRPTYKHRLTSWITWLVMLIWTLVVGGSLAWTLRNNEQVTMDMAYAAARANLDKDATLRRWATDHGGVYVPITETQTSVPWLSHVPGRDVSTTDGRQLTLLNPASVVRQMMDRYARDYGIRGRITGLKYLNPGNAPDPWEKLQLDAFTRGERKEVWAITDIGGQPYLRYLRAMFMEPGCEKCHAILGYKAGDMRGATGLNLPLASYYQQIDVARRDFGLTHGVIWLLGLSGIGISSRLARRRVRALRESEAIIGSTDDAVISKTLDGIIKSWNPGAEKIFGYTAEEVIGQSMQMLIPPDRWQEESDILARIAHGERVEHFETVRRCKNGRLIDLSATISPIFDEQGKVVGASKIARDITRHKAAEEQLRKLSQAVEQSSESIIITNIEGVIEYVNETFSRNSGYSREEAMGQNPRILKSGKTPPETFAALWGAIAQGHPWRGELHNRRKDGSEYIEVGVISPIRQPDGRVTHYLAVQEDITAKKAAEDTITNLAFYDPLTTLPNRRLLLDRLKQALAASARNKKFGALLIIDLDNFKTLNDTLGHDVGDILLQQVARRLLGCIREGDTAARLGSDEYAVMLEDLSENALEAATQAETVGGKIRLNLNRVYQLGGREHHSTPSIGVALFGGDQHESVDESLRRTELAMFQAKAAGRNTLRFFDPGMQAEVNARAVLEADLREAVLKNQFLLHYQAQVVGQGRVTGVEALVRWRHPVRGLVSPAMFIALAEETGLILPLGQWVLKTACLQLAHWASRPAMADLTVAVNVSAHQFHHKDFVAQVLEILELTGANPRRLKLELTESVLVDDVESIIAKMNALKARGVGFSLDDFGTGYSSLSYLKRLPLDQLKIDQGFVRTILSDPNDAAIAKMVVALAESLGLAVIAEGVEIEAQRDFLARQGCHAYQGYLFSRPLPIEEFEALASRASDLLAGASS